MADKTKVEKETLEGYVVDIACLRTAPSYGLEEMAEEHTTACALMGHCIESGYGLVRKDGSMTLLDPKATPHVVWALTQASTERGAWLRVERQQNGDKMETVSALEVVDTKGA